MDENRVTKAPLPREVDAEEIARGLSEGERAALSADRGTLDVDGEVEASLVAKGLLSAGGRIARLTPLGRRVLASGQDS